MYVSTDLNNIFLENFTLRKIKNVYLYTIVWGLDFFCWVSVRSWFAPNHQMRNLIWLYELKSQTTNSSVQNLHKDNGQINTSKVSTYWVKLVQCSSILSDYMIATLYTCSSTVQYHRINTCLLLRELAEFWNEIVIILCSPMPVFPTL